MGLNRRLAVSILAPVLLGAAPAVAQNASPNATLVKTWDINRATGGDDVDASGIRTDLAQTAAERPTVLRLRTVNGSDQLWFGISSGATSVAKKDFIRPELGLIDPATNVFTRWDVYDRRDPATGAIVTAGANVVSGGPPLGLALGADGGVWMTGSAGRTAIVRKLPGVGTDITDARNRQIVSYRPITSQTPGDYPNPPGDTRGIVLLPNGNALVLVEDAFGRDQLVEVPASPLPASAGAGTAIVVSSASGRRVGSGLNYGNGPNLALDPADPNIAWFSEPTRNGIARLNRSTGVLTEWTLPAPQDSTQPALTLPIDIKVRTDGVWFTVAGALQAPGSGAIGKLVLASAGATTGTFQFYRRGTATVAELYAPQLIALATSTDLWFAEAGTQSLTFLRPTAATATLCPPAGCAAIGVTSAAASVTQFFEAELNTVDAQSIDLDTLTYPTMQPVDTPLTLNGMSNNGFTAFAVPQDPPPAPPNPGGEPQPFSIEIAPGSPLRVFATERFESTPSLWGQAARQRGKLALAVVTTMSNGLGLSCSDQTFYSVNATAAVTIAPPVVNGGSGTYTYALADTVSGRSIGTPINGGGVPASLPAGTTSITETVTDAVNSALTATCTFRATLVQTAKLTVGRPIDVTTLGDTASGASSVTLPAVTVAGGTPPYVVSYSRASGSAFANGTATVTVTVTDSGSGSDGGSAPPQQSSQVTFTVTVVPRLIVTAPAAVSVTTVAAAGAAVTLPPPGIAGGTPGYAIAYTPASGSTFPVGATTVAATVTDSGAGAFKQSATVTFTVTVTQLSAPTPPGVTIVTTPASFPVTADTFNGRTVQYVAQPEPGTFPVVSTSCATAPVAGLVSGSVFPIGTTTITCTARDDHGLASAPATAVVTILPPASVTACYVGVFHPEVGAVQRWSIVGDTVVITTTLTRNFVDNTYGKNSIGWRYRHRLRDLIGSDFLQLALFDAAGMRRMEMRLDYLSHLRGRGEEWNYRDSRWSWWRTDEDGNRRRPYSLSAFHDGRDDDGDDDDGDDHFDTQDQYLSLGVTGGDGMMLLGSSASVVGVTTSLQDNFAAAGYRLTRDSPATTSRYAVNARYPDWKYEVSYTVTVKLSAFGSAGFGKASITGVWATPNKTGYPWEAFRPSSTCLVP